MGRRPAGSRKGEIAEAILRIAGREGVAALTMERLGRELGITSGALFRHFPSRTAMLNEAARHAVTLAERSFPPADLPPVERLRGFVVARTRLAAQHGGIPQLVFSEQFGKALPPSGARAVRGIVVRTREFLVDALREAAARGEVRRDVSPEELALTLIGSVFARALLAALAEGRQGERTLDADTTWSTVRTLLELGVPAPKRRSSRKSGGKRAIENG